MTYIKNFIGLPTLLVIPSIVLRIYDSKDIIVLLAYKGNEQEWQLKAIHGDLGSSIKQSFGFLGNVRDPRIFGLDSGIQKFDDLASVQQEGQLRASGSSYRDHKPSQIYSKLYIIYLL